MPILLTALLIVSAAPAADPEPASTDPNDPMSMMMDDPLGLGMSREGSGTAWQPDSIPVYGHHFMVDQWMLMLHYNALAGYDYQSGPRGGQQVMSVNWIMLMAQHSLGAGQLTLRAMLSAEPLTTGGPSGYPLLLQTGEAVDGVALHDRQHPHNLFMELAALYKRELRDGLGLELYLAPSGEPALGPVAFPHRLSASTNPFAALSHHWQDSTHISFGVVTAAIYSERVKLEASWFNGREPDQNRYAIELRVPDSYSARLSFNPNQNWSAQASYGFLKSPEQLEPGVSVQRVTASVAYNRRFSETGNWASTAVFGRDIPSSGPATNTVLLESNWELEKNSIFSRVEFIQRTGHDLVLSPADENNVFPAAVFELGYVRDVLTLGSTTVGIGAVVSIYRLGSGLLPYYGNAIPFGAMGFIRIRPTELFH